MVPIDIRKVYSQILSELRTVLINCGVPESAIATDVVLRYRRGCRREADLIIVSNDAKTILAQFEVKIGRDSYDMARDQLRDLSKRYKCYVVTKNNGETVVSTIDESLGPNWVNLSDMEGIKRLLGDYCFESAQAIDKANHKIEKAVEGEWNWFRGIIGGVGFLLILSAGALEWHGHEFSWKIYFLLFVFLAFYAAASGYVVHIKMGENEVSIEKNPKGKESK